MTSFDIHQILATLPHRYPFVMLDRVLELEANVSVKAIKNVTINEPYFVGHFPVRPVMPGVLIIEALAQAAAMLAFASGGSSAGHDRVVYLVGVDNARFKRPVEPGDQLLLEAWLERIKGGVHRYRTQASVEGQMAAEAVIMCTERKVG
ncbi:MAG TPA: 3-hydroxyacyl-ACP dehydratase FabZ [Rubrivivax sp.]|jgi:3-hydroxyacyl-[acyl-carrier-protein] dehydratase|nr:3-hydroxyacyl-ACP dehydratase FabZ [Pseudomonadota bacterium]HPP83683.1 3-hydroxyacyl-ACP dehydratase FabZ [Rubrivivax sp.]